MRRGAVFAGLGGIAFGALTLVAFALAGPPGGSYNAANITDYLAHSHRPAVFVAFYLGLVGLFGLIILLAHLRDALGVQQGNQRAATIVWGAGLAGVASFSIGWAVIGGQIVAHLEGGHAIVIAPPLTYLIGEIGVVMIFGSGAVLLGLALILLGVACGRLWPGWLRWLTVIAGVGSVAGLAFFPFFLLLIWSAVTGIWLLVADRGNGAPSTAAIS
jgi:hypothetical protein